jgi:hypothetical protein
MISSKGLESLPAFFGGFAVAAVFGVLGLVRQERRLRRFPCPACGEILAPSEPRVKGSRLTFPCMPCDTVWDTGFVTDPDD